MIRRVVVLLCFAWAPLALAQLSSLPPPTLHEHESALPQAGDVELILEAPPILNATNLSNGLVTRGLGVTTGAGPVAQNTTTVGLGLNGGVGYYLTDIFEVGAALAIDYGESSAFGVNINDFQFGIEPFVKANFGRVLKGLHFSPFVQLGVIAGMATAPQDTGLFGFDLDVGIDFLISRGWGVSAFIPLALVDQTGVGINGVASFSFGVGYGLVTYF
ncbi:MAG: hypothetical protein ACYDCL_03295 [Myxococcales bacterium]